MTVRIDTLSNGFRVVTERMPALESAAIGVWVLSGGRHERAEENGVAHFLEHMAFKGTARRSAVQIAEAIEDVGGYMNAYTSREATAYYARVLGADVPLALDVIGDIVLNSVFDAREIELERGVILQEIGQAADTPDDIIFDWLQERAYPGQALGRPILGPSEAVRRFGRADLDGFVSRHYSPGNMILSAAGAVDHDELVRLAEDMFGAMKPAAVPPLEAATFEGGDLRVEKQLEQAHFALAFEGPKITDPAIHTAQVYAAALGGGMSSRLFQEIRERRGLCYTIFAQAGAFSDTGMMTIYAGTSGDQIGELVGLTLDEMKRAADDMSEAELARARAQLKAGLLMGLESPSNRAERLARMLQIKGRIPPPEEVVAEIDAVGVRDVREMAGHMVAEARTALALYGPVSGAPGQQALQDRRAA
ncbi:MAG: pitrilysin family protein [Sediminimonas sp.]|uniref:Insulinase family protein n=1 Tax=Sediminimonas qiaohouensis TaxID=552061 RepID=A0A7C9L6Z6_9RHOB|nr:MULTISPECIES: pitrilysin family protein [Sediminimonas]MDR9484153.1 pitrilysin family protein [Sediminimonas sp.]MTJ03274.1 insulinase family protein [Sediminimonas qiaohouensis]